MSLWYFMIFMIIVVTAAGVYIAKRDEQAHKPA